MCVPGAAGTASLATQGFGVGMSTIGAFMGAKMQQSQLRHQAVLADINATVEESNARNIIRAGTIEESRIKLKGAQAKGAAINRMAGSGIDIAGSPTAIARLAGNDLITEVDAQTIRSNALRAAMGQRFEAGNYRREADAARASAAGISPLMAGATSLISGAGQVARSWYALNKEGAFGSPAAPSPTGKPDGLLDNWSFGHETGHYDSGSPEGHYGVYTHEGYGAGGLRPGLRYGGSGW